MLLESTIEGKFEEGNIRPLVSFTLFTYNQEAFVREAVEGAFSQTYSPLEIILSDDCSTDRTFEIMKKMVEEYSGPHKVILNRNSSNLGLGGNFNKALEMISGELIILAAGDDISLPERTSVTVQYWVESGKQIKSLYCDAITINESSEHIGSTYKIYENDYINVLKNEDIVLGCAHAIDREVLRVFGPLDPDVVKEDLVVPFRSLLLGSVVRIPQQLVKYRICESNWKKKGRSIQGQNEKLGLIRYKNGILNISAFEQILNDVKIFKDKGNNGGIPFDQIEKALDKKIREHRAFVSLIDLGYIYIVHAIFKEKCFATPELRALKRYTKLLKMIQQ